MHAIPHSCPKTLNEAFAFVAAADSPSIDMLKVMVMVEAAGKALYEDMALGTQDEGVRALLRHNGREELAHAHRVAKAIAALSGEAYSVPEPHENPYLIQPIPRGEVTCASLRKLAEAEYGGEDLYARWASNCASAEAAALFRQNGREEVGHGDRLQQAATLLAV